MFQKLNKDQTLAGAISHLQRDKDYFRKICLLQKEHVLDQTEVKYRLGEPLSKAFFEACLPPLKRYLGVIPLLEGPGDELWNSPSDILIGKVRLKPPLTDKQAKAFTHKTIIDIGSELEEKYWYKFDRRLKKAVEEKKKFINESERRFAAERTEAEQKQICNIMLEMIEEGCRETLLKELRAFEERMLIEQEVAVKAGKKQMQEFMEKKLDWAIYLTVKLLVDQFAVELMKQSKKMHTHFWYHYRTERKRLKDIIAKEQSSCRDKLSQLRVEMECENIANVMYVMAVERRQCVCEKQALEQNFLAQVHQLETELRDRTEKLNKVTKMLEQAGQQVLARENALFEIIKQFQKFIYFVLRSVPLQAEYLLNVEKLMIFELTETVMTTKPDFLSWMNKVPTYYGYSETYDSTMSSVSAWSGIKTRNNVKGLVPNDYHDCVNKANINSSAHSLAEEIDLPIFKFKENLYVREDFKNMISQGLRISRSHKLWNFQMENVMKEYDSDLRENAKLAPKAKSSGSKCGRHLNKVSSPVSVRFSLFGPAKIEFNDASDDKEEKEEKVLHSHAYDTYSIRSPQTSTEDLEQEPKSSKLYIRDSLELIPTKLRKSSDIQKRDRGTSIASHRDSLLLITKRSVDAKIACTQDVMRRMRPDRSISSAKDSLVLLRSRQQSSIKHNTSRETIIGYPYATVIDKPVYKNKKLVDVGVQCKSKTLVISHIEVIPDDSDEVEEEEEEEDRGKSTRRYSFVDFLPIPNIIPCEEYLKSSEEFIKRHDEPVRVKRSIDMGKYEKPKQFKIVGDETMDVYDQNTDTFTAGRVKSMLKIFRENPSLRDIFTEVTKHPC